MAGEGNCERWREGEDLTIFFINILFIYFFWLLSLQLFKALAGPPT